MSDFVGRVTSEQDHFKKLDTALAPMDHLICFAMKSNSNLSVLRTLANLGSGFEDRKSTRLNSSH